MNFPTYSPVTYRHILQCRLHLVLKGIDPINQNTTNLVVPPQWSPASVGDILSRDGDRRRHSQNGPAAPYQFPAVTSSIGIKLVVNEIWGSS